MKHVTDFRPEDQLLLNCARHVIRGDMADPIKSLLKEKTDWTYLIRSALAHGVTPLLFKGVRQTGEKSVPEEIGKALGIYCDSNRKRNEYLLSELLDLITHLSENNIESIPFKGPSLGMAAYGSTSARCAGDLDILLQEKDLKKACEILSERGFYEVQGAWRLQTPQDAAYRRFQSQYRFLREHDGVVVEPHWSISPGLMGVNHDYAAIWKRSDFIRLRGKMVRSFGIEDHLLILCEHGSKHQWRKLSQICDIAALLERNQELDWSRTFSRAADLGTMRMLLVALSLAELLFNTPVPPIFKTHLARDVIAPRMLEDILVNLFQPCRKRIDIFSFSLFRFRMRERLRDRLLYLFRTLTTPTLSHYRLISLPAPLFFLYYPVKLIHDFVMLPSWKAGKPFVKKRTRHEPGKPHGEIKAAVRHNWEQRSSGWIRQAEQSTRQDEKINKCLLDAANVNAGQHVLDLASGAGNPTMDIAKKVGHTGHVMAIDLVTPMMVSARRQSELLSCTNISFAVSDMETLPFKNNLFDSVVCRLGIMFCPNIKRALSEAFRVLKRRGRTAFLVFGPKEKNTVFHVLEQSIAPAFEQVPSQGDLTPFRFCRPGSLTTLMREAGFSCIHERELVFDSLVNADKNFWRSRLDAQYGFWIDSLPDSGVRVLDDSLRSAFSPYLEGDQYRLHNHLRLIVASHP